MSKDVYSTIKENILSGAYKSGEIIKEKELSEEFDVSRTPVRESLARLEWEKLVTIIPRAGAMVAPIELSLVREAYQVRFVLDGYLGKLAASHVSDDQIEALEAIRKECEGYVRSGTQEDLNRLSRDFREILGQAANNRTLFELCDLLFNISLRIWYTAARDGKHSELASTLVSEFDAVIEALRNRDEQAAQKAMQDAIVYYTKKLKESF